jgi:O-antigen ligase
MGAVVGVVLGLVVVDGALKLLLAVLGAAFIVIGIIEPRVIMYVLMVIVATLSQTKYGLETQGVFRISSYVLDPVRFNLYEILVYCLFIVLLAQRALGRRPREVPNWITVPCLVTGLIVIVQVARAMLAGAPYADVVAPFNGQYVLAAVVALWCFCELLGSASERLRMLDLLFVCASGRALFALGRYLVAGGDTANAYRELGVKVALWESADHLLFVFLIGVTIAAWACRRVHGTRLMLWAGGSVFMVLTVALSYRRTGWFGLAAALIILSLMLLRRDQRAVALVPVVFGTLIAVGVASYSRFSVGGGLIQRLFPDVVSRVEPTRQDEWALAWSTVAQNPILGEFTSERLVSRFATWDTRIVHNAFLFSWMKLGIAGMLSLVVLGGACVAYAVRGARARGLEDYISFGVIGLLPFALLLAMFETPLIETRTLLILAVAAALGVRVAHSSDPAPGAIAGPVRPEGGGHD